MQCSLANWRIPKLTDDMTVQAQFTVQADGKLTDPKVSVVTEFVGDSDEVERKGLGDRTLTSFQLDDAVTLVRERYCQTSPAPVQGEQPTKASAPQESGV
jgi:hypothetical protein